MAETPKYHAVLTDLGKQLLEAAYHAGQKIEITSMSLGDSNLEYVTPDKTFTSLVNEFGSQAINEGNTTDSMINAIVYVDSARFASKSVLEFGLRDVDGNLIVYGAYPASVVPDSVTGEFVQLEIECNVYLHNASAVSLTVNPIYPHATEQEAGIARIATLDEVIAGEDDGKIVTARKLGEMESIWLPPIYEKLMKLPIHAHILTPTNTMSFTQNITEKSIIIDDNQVVRFRGHHDINTSNIDINDRTFNYVDDKTYHIRMSENGAISFNDLDDIEYNPEQLNETNIVFDSTITNALLAKLENGVLIALKNTPDVLIESDIESIFYESTVYKKLEGSDITYNLSRTPSSNLSFRGLKTTTAGFESSTLGVASDIFERLAVQGVANRYSAYIKYVYKDHAHSHGRVIMDWMLLLRRDFNE